MLILVVAALIIQFLPKAIVPVIYANTEILLGRFLIFFIGCWSGKKVYQKEYITQKEKIGLLFGMCLMLGNHLPIIDSVISKLNYRFLMCFWGIFFCTVLR